MALHVEAAGAILFLALYFLVFLWMVHGFFTKRLSLKSRYAVVLLHVLVRLASQSCNIAFLQLGFRNISVFIAYLILGAEGYFTLVACSFRFLIRWERSYTDTGTSFLEPEENPSGIERRKRILQSLAVLPAFWPSVAKREPELPAHAMMVIANTLIITGGSYLANAIDPNTDLNSDEVSDHLKTAKALRTTGQVLLVSINVFLGLCIIRAHRHQAKSVRPKPHPTLLLLCIAWIPLIIRGIYGVLQSAVWRLSYYDPHNYTAHGFTSSYTAVQDVLGVATEWTAVVLLNATSHTDLIYRPLNASEANADEGEK